MILWTGWAYEIQLLGMGAVDLNFIMKTDFAQIPKNSWILVLLSNQMDTSKSPILWIDICTLIYYWCQGVLWLLQIVIGAKWNAEKTVFENHTLKQANEEMFRKHENSYAAMGIAVSPLFLLFWRH